MPRRLGAAAARALLLVIVALLARTDGQTVVVEESDDTYAKAKLVPKLDVAVRSFMERPFEMALDFTEAAQHVGALDLTSRVQLSQVMYTQTLATKCGEPGNPFDMVYLGLEDGTFVGYFSPTSYTYRPPSGTMTDQLSWEPYTLENINGVCDQTPGACDFPTAINDGIASKACIGDDAACAAADISGGAGATAWERLDAGRTSCTAAGSCRFSSYGGRTWDGKVVSSNCDRTDPDTSSCAAMGLTGDAAADLVACEALGGCAYVAADTSSGTAAACAAACTDTCCDGDLRIYYTSDAVGEPVEMTRWRVYDHRARTWYIQQKERFETTNNAFGWSDVYSFATSGALGISATAMINDAAGAHGVAAIDYTLGMISQLITDQLIDIGEDLSFTWAYIVELDGTLMGSTTDECTDRSSGSVVRLKATEASHSGAALSATYLEENGWPVVDGVALSDENVRIEIGTFAFEDRGLVWLIVVGQNTDCSSTDTWTYGKCTTCASGTKPINGVCVPCAAGYAGINGVCESCVDGTEPNAEKTFCEACPRGTAGTNGQCKMCNAALGEVPNGAATSCICPSGTYDRYQAPMPSLDPRFQDGSRGFCADSLGISVEEAKTQADCEAHTPAGNWIPTYHIYCWGRGKMAQPQLDGLNSASLTDLMTDASSSRCIACPSCVTCEPGLITVNPDFAIATELHDACPPGGAVCQEDVDLDIYKCGTDGCPGNFLTNDTAASLVCQENHQGLLCGACDAFYGIQGGICTHCAGLSTGGILTLLGIVLIIIIANMARTRIEEFSPMDTRIRFWRRVIEKSWPRFNQAWKILASNLQISSSIAYNCYIEWPGAIGAFFQMVGSIVNVSPVAIPGLACLLTTSYYLKWSVQMLMLPIILLICFAIFKVKARALFAEKEAKTTQSPLEQVSLDLSLAIQIGQIKSSASSWAFMSVYLLYPASCSAVFGMFKCTAMDGDTAYLVADTRQACRTLNGELDETYALYSSLAYICVVVYALGIPFVLGLMMYLQREVIKQNPDYVTLAAFKPLFQFYKPECYMWEIYFMLQKMILVGLMGVFQASLTQKMFQVVLSMVVICAVCYAMPSKTKQFNYANIISQASIVVNFLMTILLSQMDNNVAGLSADEIQYIVIIGLQIMMLYLVFVIFEKTREIIAESSKEVRSEMVMLKQLRSGELQGDSTSDEDRDGADQAIQMAFAFFDEDGGGSVNLYEIQHVLSLFGIQFDAAGRDAIINLTAEMSGNEVLKDELKEELTKLGLDLNVPIDREKLMEAITHIDLHVGLSHFGWDTQGDNAHALDVVLEEMVSANEGEASWYDFFEVCEHRLTVKDATFSELETQAHALEEDICKAVLMEDSCFAAYLYPNGLPQRPAPTEGDPYATELDTDRLNGESISNACLDSHLPAESLRSLIVRSQYRVDRLLSEMDVKQLKETALKALVDPEIIEAASHTSKEALHDEIDRQTREIPYDVFRAVWLSQMRAATPTTVVAGDWGENPVAAEKDEFEDSD